jgi:hypothetical protein
MSDLILLLGPFLFQENEIPASINFGGTQMMSVQQMIGGARDVQSLGPSDSDITWSGLFFNNATTGLSALDRVRELDILRALGLELPFVFYDLAYTVKIKSFTPIFERFYQIPYKITLQVVYNLNVPFGGNGALSFIESILNDLNSVSAGAGFLNDPALNGAIDSFKNALGGAGDLNSASPSVMNGLISSSMSVSHHIGTLINQYKNNLSGH